MRRVGACVAKLSFRSYKTSTGLVGLAVDKNGRETLLSLSAQCLESVKVKYYLLQLYPSFPNYIHIFLLCFSNSLLHHAINLQKIPATSAYRSDVEKWCNFFTKVATNNGDIKAIESEIALGQIEEVIEMVKDELKLVDIYYDSKGWEMVADEQKRADSLVAAMADSIYFSTPQTAPPAPEVKK